MKKLYPILALALTWFVVEPLSGQGQQPSWIYQVQNAPTTVGKTWQPITTADLHDTDLLEKFGNHDGAITFLPYWGITTLRTTKCATTIKLIVVATAMPFNRSPFGVLRFFHDKENLANISIANTTVVPMASLAGQVCGPSPLDPSKEVCSSSMILSLSAKPGTEFFASPPITINTGLTSGTCGNLEISALGNWGSIGFIPLQVTE
jgi:hypothetical protein